MLGLLATLLFLHLGHPLEAACPLASLANFMTSSSTLSWEGLNATWLACVNISGRDIAGIRGAPGQRSPLRELDLSHNHLSSLPPGFLNHTEELEHLFLQGNHLPELPPAFFEKTGRLKELRLEGNPLLSVPPSLLQLCLESLSVDCHCQVAGSISSYCQRNNCTRPVSCHCSSPQGLLNATDFYAQQCRGLPVAVYVAIAVSLLALLLGAAVVYIVVRRKKGAATVREKRESTTSNGAQPRYISHGGLQADPAQRKGGHADYENVFIGQAQEVRGGKHKERHSRKPPKSRSHQKAQEAEAPPGEQPIYANTQDVYYNYVGTPAPLDEDFYVMPDQ
ncbi:leucine-rich repeat-containing protein 25 [Heteronotia binoei]|uniref:leucine-rich repeat-containing protein 25 n=1 Tax=Heteronotia binoei TaxID=13085 RepID=UPI00292FBB44|nr:leucine-rich repeat-containing protein 25 [Heteronotia binoei]